MYSPRHLLSPPTSQSGHGVASNRHRLHPAPGRAASRTVKLTATITAIDKATRDVTLKGPQGNDVTVTASPEVKNFDQLKVGDQVDLNTSRR